MKLKPLHDPANGKLLAVGFMSGSGTNLCRVLEHEQQLATERGSSPYHICAIFSDTADSRAAEIGAQFNIPVLLRDIRAYYKAHALPRTDMTLRSRYDAETVKLLAPFAAKVAVFAGYMSIASPVLIRAFLGVNVHPADLAVQVNGQRRWVGGHAVRDAIAAGEPVIRSTTHIVEPEVDGGRILMVSAPVQVQLPEGIDLKDKQQLKLATNSNQERLKKAGDWVIMPRTIEYLADGRFAATETGALCFDGQPVPGGLRLEN